MAAVHVLAPAKINLTLHVTGRTGDGYHTLNSLVAFADIGDQVTIEPPGGFAFSARGPFAREFSAQELDAGPESANLVVRAAREMARMAERDLQAKITLTKNLPLAAGIGGGSADAAAVLWGLAEFWHLPPDSLPWLPALAAGLGADVPVCLACRPTRMRGIGERLEDVSSMPEMPVLLVNPGVRCPTAEVFRRFAGRFSEEVALPESMDAAEWTAFLAAQGNDLTEVAVSLVPEIAFALEDIKGQQGCALARMSGSGATCFGLFNDEAEAMDAAENLTRNHPGWWVRAGTLNRPVRY